MTELFADLRCPISLFPIVPRFIEREGRPVAYEDGTPTLTPILEALLAEDPSTEKFLQCAVVGCLGIPLVDLRRRKG